MSEIGTMLADTCARLFADQVTPDLLDRAERGGWPDELWEALEGTGLTRPLVPEAQGGAGLGWRDTAEIIRAAAYHATPVPLAETITAGWLLAQAGIDVPQGPLTLVPEGSALLLAGDRVSGTLAQVPWGRYAGHVLAPVTHTGGIKLVLLARDTAMVREDRNIGRDPRDTLTFVQSVPVAVADMPEACGNDALLIFGALARAVQMAGAVESVLDMTVGYAGERTQFGRPIAKFQAVQHRLAQLASQAASVQTAAHHACRAADVSAVPREALLEVAVAKIRAGEAAGEAAAAGHQVHGAIGFTEEYRLHYLTRRLWAWRAEFGSEADWAERLGRAVAARGADSMWPDITARP